MVCINRKEKVIKFLEEAAPAPLLFEELANILNVSENDRAEFLNILDELIDEGCVIRTKKKRYCASAKLGFIKGKFIGNEKGFGFVEISGSDKDLFIPECNTGTAMHGDIVLAKITSSASGGKRAEGEVVKIIEENNSAIVGTVELSKNFAFVIADEKRISKDIFISYENLNGAKNDDKVVVSVICRGKRNPVGKITEILGSKNDIGTDILSIIRQHGIDTEFPDKVMQYVNNIEQTIDEKQAAGRRDFRNEHIVTIDGADAKDLDDAVGVKKLKNGNYQLSVHIADVGHYVPLGSPVDREAFKRGTSVYLADRVVPMLPTELSNGICSLNPQMDRLTLSVIMEIDNSGKVVNHEICEGIIRTTERMTYENVTKILEGDSEQLERYKTLVEDFRLMNELRKILKKKRISRGSIDFDFPEAKVILNDEGVPIDVKKYEITVSNQIIEEFMLVCNETVAEFMFWNNIPFVYRVHEDPSSEKITAFKEFIRYFGYSFGKQKAIYSSDFQRLLAKIKGTKEERIISTIMLRSLMKARYCSENLGHFGLAAKYYCHFTSPIRRYPDLTIHRIIKDMLHGSLTDYDKLSKFVEKSALHSSEREIEAAEAERETEDLKKAEYMESRLGEVYDGIISSVTSFGIFAELENTIEGLIRLSDLTDDYYIYDDKRKCLTGERTGRIYKIGDSITIMVAKADRITRQIDFVPVSKHACRT